MSNEQLLIALVIGLVAIILVIKFWRLAIGIAVVVGIPATFLLCQSGEIRCPFGNGSDKNGQGSHGAQNLTKNEAIAQVKAYLLRVSATHTQHKQDCYYKSRQCRDWDYQDQQKLECQKRYKTEVKWIRERVCDTKTETIGGPCSNPPRGHDWTAQYDGYNAWLVSIYWQNRRYTWTVQDQTRDVSSHQPPC